MSTSSEDLNANTSTADWWNFWKVESRMITLDLKFESTAGLYFCPPISHKLGLISLEKFETLIRQPPHICGRVKNAQRFCCRSFGRVLIGLIGILIGFDWF